MRTTIVPPGPDEFHPITRAWPPGLAWAWLANSRAAA
jgi:hypothetical protein